MKYIFVAGSKESALPRVRLGFTGKAGSNHFGWQEFVRVGIAHLCGVKVTFT
ncbi:hypothetical protein JYG36_17685 [Pseudomonas sp. SORT22]|uniref:hypothetical protein n=1 Tax=Pseudomonas sp. SORT22 TaxID=2813842 RepID=UPI001BCFEB79|nr:hypothetical protein [Pseudomonas sp. SORT22]QVM94945.1 hypothetical protein JYG36_17685 [Pseudomonas sp. SORT22]